jgi:uncharacterized membrane protein
MVVPLFIAIGMFRKAERGRSFLIAALILMALGTVSAFVATSTGEAAKDLAESKPGIEAVLEQHEDLAETTQVAFSALTLIYAAILFAPRLLPRSIPPRIAMALPVAFLVLYSAGLLLLVNTAHQGGRLVHEPSAVAQASSPPGASVERD